MSNVISLTSPSPQIFKKTQTGVFLISGFLLNPLQRQIFIGLEPVMLLTWNLDQQLNLARKAQQPQKHLIMRTDNDNCDVNLPKLRSWIPEPWSWKLLFSLIVTFYLTKTKNRIIKSLTQLSYYWLSKGAIFDKIADISKIRGAIILKGIFFETTYVCTYVQNFKFLA